MGQQLQADDAQVLGVGEPELTVSSLFSCHCPQLGVVGDHESERWLVVPGRMPGRTGEIIVQS